MSVCKKNKCLDTIAREGPTKGCVVKGGEASPKNGETLCNFIEKMLLAMIRTSDEQSPTANKKMLSVRYQKRLNILILSLHRFWGEKWFSREQRQYFRLWLKCHRYLVQFLLMNKCKGQCLVAKIMEYFLQALSGSQRSVEKTG